MGSGKHKHNHDTDGSHTHTETDFKEGIQLIIKGKNSLKNLPNISIKEKKKRKPKDNTKKKEELEKLVDIIEDKMKDFEGKKQIVGKVLSNGNTIEQVPVYIPQFTVPDKPSKEDLNDIINDIFVSENNLRQFYEQKTNQPFEEIEEIFDNQEDEGVPNRGDTITETEVIPNTEDTITEQTALRPSPSPSPPENNLIEVVGEAVDDTEDKLIQWFNNSSPPKLQLNQSQQEFENYDKTEDELKDYLKKINKDQDEIIKLKEIELKEKEQILEQMNEVNDLNINDVDKLEDEIAKKLQIIENMKDDNERDDKIKQAEILSLQLENFEREIELKDEIDKNLQIIKEMKDGKEKDEKIKQAEILSLQLENFEKEDTLKNTIEYLKEEINDTKEELDNFKNMQKPKLSLGKDEQFQQQIEQFQLTTPEREKVSDKRLIEKQASTLTENFQNLGIEHNIGSYNNILKLEELRRQLNDDTLFSNITQDIYTNTIPKKMQIKQFLNEMKTKILELKRDRDNEPSPPENNEKDNKDDNKEIDNEEIDNEEIEKIKTEALDDVLTNLKKTLDNKYNELNKEETIYNDLLETYQEIENEYTSYSDTLEEQMKIQGINNINEINQIEDENEKEKLLVLHSFITDENNNSLNILNQLEQTFDVKKQEIEELRTEYEEIKLVYDTQFLEFSMFMNRE